MSDYFDSFKLFLYERVSNPLVTAFAFSWVIFNYAFFLMAFSGDDVAIKLVMISEYYESAGFFGWPNLVLRGLLYPALSAGLYIFALPKLSQRIVKYHYEQSTKLKNIKTEAEGETLITGKQAREFIVQQEEAEQKLEELKQNHKVQIKAFQEQTNTLSETVNQLSKTVLEKDNEIEQLRNSLSDRELSVQKSYKEIESLKTQLTKLEVELEQVKKFNKSNSNNSKIGDQVITPFDNTGSMLNYFNNWLQPLVDNNPRVNLNDSGNLSGYFPNSIQQDKKPEITPTPKTLDGLIKSRNNENARRKDKGK